MVEDYPPEPPIFEKGEFKEFKAQLERERAMTECLRRRPRLSTSTIHMIYGTEVPEGFHLHHICGNRWCGKAEHLIAVSPEDHRKLHRKESFCA